MKQKQIAPEKKLEAFNCPICNVYAKQEWCFMGGLYNGGVPRHGRCISLNGNKLMYTDELMQYYQKVNITKYSLEKALLACCTHCNGISVWLDDKMIVPEIGGVEQPNQDLDDNIKKDYIEAASVLHKSPRASAALLRLCLEKLCNKITESGGDLNEKIGTLVKQGLSTKIQQSLDSVRVIGNNAVHPGVMDIKDNKKVAIVLFQLLNNIAYHFLTHPKEIDLIYGALPDTSKEAIKKRDNKSR